MEKEWEFKKGKSPEFPIISESGNPIPKENIDQNILEYIYNKVNPEEKQLLQVSDFNLYYIW